MNSSGLPSTIARALAEVFTNGGWTFDELVEHGSLVLPRQRRWLRPLAKRVLLAFPQANRPRSVQVAAFLLNDAGFRLALDTYKPTLRFDRWPKPEMTVAEGPPSTWNLPKLATTGDLAKFLDLEPARLDWFADRAGLLINRREGPLRHYRYEWRLKRSGKPRLIEAPKPELKRIQRRVLSRILDLIPPHDAAHGFRSGRSILSFARDHVARAVVLKMDLCDFFASIPATRVEAIFSTAGYPEAVAKLLTGLCTSRTPRDVLRAGTDPDPASSSKFRELHLIYGKRHLPQGAPTSPALANLSAFRLDARLSGLAHASGGTYSRYADDLVFSGDERFARYVERFAIHVAAIVLEEGFAVNHRKTRIMRPGVRQRIAGVVVNERLNVSREQYDRLKATLYNCVRHGPESQNLASLGDFRAHLAGRIAHVSMVNEDRGRRLRELFDRVIWLVFPARVGYNRSRLRVDALEKVMAMPNSPLVGRHLLDRRGFLAHMGSGLGGIALSAMLAEQGLLAAEKSNVQSASMESPLAPKPPHFPAKAKRVLHIFCTGALSHVDTWDYKPELIKRHGQPMPGVDKLVTFQGENGNLTKSPWEFKPRGETGKYVSELIPHLAGCVDDLCFIHSLTSKSSTHGPGEIFMSTGFTLEGFPSMGSWISYSLGTENQDLPAFVAIPDPRGEPQQGPANWANGFLPAVYQGTSFNADKPIRHLARPEEVSPGDDKATKDFLRLLNDEHLKRNPGDTELSARIAAYELAARMQLSAPEVGDLSRESPTTQELYGLNESNPITAGFGRNCLLARRLLERGVRFVTLFNGAFAMGEGALNWDGHKQIKSDYDRHGPILDKPAAGLLKDLKARGMLDDTLVVWTTEFGRMPTFQKGTNGRDHNPKGFTAWLAGAGVKRGYSFGATDEFGYRAIENVVDVHDFHATILHLLGLDHTKLTYYYNGSQRRLTDVHGRVIKGVMS